MSNYSSGHWAEKAALTFLCCKGYRLLHHNYITGRGTYAGEIDLIMTKSKTLVFVEVKKRRNIEQAAYAVLPRQQERIRRAAEVFIAKNPRFAGFTVRFDVFLVGFPFSFQHLKNAF